MCKKFILSRLKDQKLSGILLIVDSMNKSPDNMLKYDISSTSNT